MLRINVIRSAADAKKYYVSGLSRPDYYTTDQSQEVVGQWHGKGAWLLGLRGDVTQTAFFALADNEHPTKGGTLTVRQKQERRVGYDFTFNAPKSVSLLYSLSGDERILPAFRRAVQATMRDMEADLKTRVRQQGAYTDRQTGNMVWCDFIHTVARPVDGVPDPSLHAHCVAFNATYDPKEKRWKAGEFHDLKRHAGYYEAVFHSRLAAEMRSLGFGVARHGKWWDVAGLPRDLLNKFSRRTAQVEERAAALGITDPTVKGELGARTREKKAPHLSDAKLTAAWKDRLSAADRKALARVLSGAGTAESGGQTGQLSPEETMRYAVSDCFERASVVHEKKLLESALRRGFGAVLPEQVKDAAARAGILTRTIDGQTLVTTREVLAEEHAMLAFARDGRGTCRALNPAGEVYHSETLNQDQIKAVRHVLTSSDRVMMIRGGAGTGKTTLTKAAAALIAAGGKKAFFFAPSADAADVLRKEGFKDADTVARLLVDEVLQERLRGQVLWIDEAGLLGMRDMRTVFALAGKLGCRVILSGDTMQHQSVSRGDALRLLEDKAGIRPAHVREIVRQRGSYRDAVAALEKGDIEGGFRHLDNLGWVVEVPANLRHAVLVKDYLAALAAGETALVVSPTHREGDAVTGQIRTALKANGTLGAQDRTFWTLRNLYWTEAQKSDAINYQPGLVVQFFQNAKGIKNGERLQVVNVNAAGVQALKTDKQVVTVPLHQSDRFQVYEPYRLGLTAGDTIRITQNGKSEDGRKLINGALQQVKAITDTGAIVLANGQKLGQEFGHFALGYATTSHASQGKTVDRVFIAQGTESFPASSREQFYVSVSRGRKSARIYTDDTAALRERIRESGQRASAVELVEGEVTARVKPRRIEDELRERAARLRRYRAQREKVMAAKALRLVKDRNQEHAAAQERNGHGQAMDR